MPFAQSRDYVAAARAAGAEASLVEVPGDHLDLVDPTPPAWARVVDLLEGLAPLRDDAAGVATLAPRDTQRAGIGSTGNGPCG